ncbi:hypothetical protein Hamer_G014677 [Homarus americanus]|uniref:Uncharacterized protein n=1 Tax=Homarus americanus TaxID=6706 RepID=A0A8J5N1L2_HOMAM|nr:hypothetical protein Hamer_G014677 [Homarus americanus]
MKVLVILLLAVMAAADQRLETKPFSVGDIRYEGPTIHGASKRESVSTNVRYLQPQHSYDYKTIPFLVYPY